MVLFFYDQPLLDLFDTEEFGAVVVRTLATATGLVLSVPITTGIAALTLPLGTWSAPAAATDVQSEGRMRASLEPWPLVMDSGFALLRWGRATGQGVAGNIRERGREGRSACSWPWRGSRVLARP